ncbi:MAG: transcription termination factor NusA [Nitrospinota bacterium]|nr:transcription termination factor NusA [Nitrospinota bacterium]
MTEKNITPLLEEAATGRGVSKDFIVKAIELGLSLAARKKEGLENLEALFNEKTGSFGMYKIKRAQELVNDPEAEISLADALVTDPECETGKEVRIPFNYPDIDRLTAMTVRRILKKKIDEIKRDSLQEEMELSRWKMVAATVIGRNEKDDLILSIGQKPALLPRQEQAFREEVEIGEVLQTVIIDVIRLANDPLFVVSRTHPLLLGGLFRREIPEISDGYVVIKGLARDTAGRSKIAVFSKRDDIDAIGSCVGPAGERVQRIIKELKGEKIDIIKWSETPEEYIAAALTPAKVTEVLCDRKTGEALVKTEPEQHKIAVGKGGLNIRLACRLTHWSINIEKEKTFGR